jgi:hypothetical protein
LDCSLKHVWTPCTDITDNQGKVRTSKVKVQGHHKQGQGHKNQYTQLPILQGPKLNLEYDEMVDIASIKVLNFLFANQFKATLFEDNLTTCFHGNHLTTP